ncbi:Glycine receptor subunit alpha-1 [Chionoecetes opilio]|uniref:Glycine receptor subunit alpha-1 n=1 Tax=Chionoecetes opilio TaxID=41210 RepID=A0A8J4YJV2_CHIOP|nr:Glycine receptor subunit alpha-1 [Chionoecetes opilio]
MQRGAARGTAAAGSLLFKVALTLTLFTLGLATVTAREFFMESSDTEILDFLLHKSRYDKRIRPPDKDGPVRVNVSVLLLSLSSPDESSLNYEVEFLLNQQWQDPRLKHDDNGRYAYLSGMHHLVGCVCVCVCVCGVVVVWVGVGRYLVLKCEGNLNQFPFDDPFCPSPGKTAPFHHNISLMFLFLPTLLEKKVSYEMKDLLYLWLNNTASDHGKSLAKSNKLRSLNAYMIMNKTEICEDSFFWRAVGLQERLACLERQVQEAEREHKAFVVWFLVGVCVVVAGVCGALVAGCVWARHRRHHNGCDAVVVQETDGQLSGGDAQRCVESQPCPLERRVLVPVF